jgi:hypothetical protein
MAGYGRAEDEPPADDPARHGGTYAYSCCCGRDCRSVEGREASYKQDVTVSA